MTFADVDYRDDPYGPVILFCGGMFGGRWAILGSPDALAQHHKVRLIMLDKPGLGGTGRVPLEHRIENWLDIVPGLLAHCRVSHVVLMSHSNGAIYLLNTVLRHRHLLHPTHPSLVFLAPWVHPAHSSSMRYLNWLPSTCYRNWAAIAKALVPRINDTLVFSTGIVSSARNATGTTPVLERFLGVSDERRALFPELEKTLSRNLFSEHVSGGSDEAMICAKRGVYKGPCWGLFEDYDEAAMQIVAQESRRRLAEPLTLPAQEAPRKLRIRAFYGDSDAMIGIKGGEWFNHCWNQKGVAESVDFEGEFISGVTHEGIAHPKKAVLHNVLRDIVDDWKSAPPCRASEI